MERPMKITRWSRTDSNLLQALLGLAFAIEVVLGLLLPLLAVAGLNNPVIQRDVSVTDVGTSLVADGGAKLSVSESATLSIADPGLGQRVLFTLPTIFDAVLILLGLYWLILVARTLSAGEPFASRNPSRLFGIAVLIAVGSVGDSLLTAITTDRLVAGTTLQSHVPFSLHISFLPLGIALVVAALAEAFRVGVQLRRDTEGLV
jgi:hypothetical protein